MHRTGGIRQRVHPQWLQQRGQPHAIWLQSLVVPATFPMGLRHSSSPLMVDEARRTPSRFLSELGTQRLACGDSEDKTSVRARWMVFCQPPSVLSSRFPQARYSAVLCLSVPNMPWKKKEVLDGRCIVSLGLKFRTAARKRTGYRTFGGTDFPRRGIQRRTNRSNRDFSHGDYLRAQPVRRRSFTTSQAFKGIFCADQTGSACAGLRKQNA